MAGPLHWDVTNAGEERDPLWTCAAMPRDMPCGVGAGGGTRPRYLIVCLWRRLSASHHRSF